MKIDLCRVIHIYRTSRGTEVQALRGAELHVRGPRLSAIIGPSGSGKSTLLNIIGGLLRPTGGTVLVDEVNIYELKEHELLQYRRSKVGIVYQFFNLFPSLTVEENIDFPLRLVTLPPRRRKERVSELLHLCGISEKAEHFPSELSGGERQRVALAVAMANNPPLLLADEPTAELDTETGLQVVRLLRDLSRRSETSVIVTTHDAEMVKEADEVSQLRDGRIGPAGKGEEERLG